MLRPLPTFCFSAGLSGAEENVPVPPPPVPPQVRSKAGRSRRGPPRRVPARPGGDRAEMLLLRRRSGRHLAARAAPASPPAAAAARWPLGAGRARSRSAGAAHGPPLAAAVARRARHGQPLRATGEPEQPRDVSARCPPSSSSSRSRLAQPLEWKRCHQRGTALIAARPRGETGGGGPKRREGGAGPHRCSPASRSWTGTNS